ncbi:MAG: cytochrome c3 family protein [Desulfatibacillaceae bacterium]
MRKKNWVVGGIILAAVMFVAAGLYAQDCPDVIKMKNPAYEEHTKGIVEFTHTKHYKDYGIGCGDCHHDDKGQPLTGLKEGDDVQDCIECHSKPGEMPRDVKKELRQKKASREEIAKAELDYHAEAIHANCITCHRDHNKEHKTRAAPTTCSKCHPRN